MGRMRWVLEQRSRLPTRWRDTLPNPWLDVSVSKSNITVHTFKSYTLNANDISADPNDGPCVQNCENWSNPSKKTPLSEIRQAKTELAKLMGKQGEWPGRWQLRIMAKELNRAQRTISSSTFNRSFYSSSDSMTSFLRWICIKRTQSTGTTGASTISRPADRLIDVPAGPKKATW